MDIETVLKWTDRLLYAKTQKHLDSLQEAILSGGYPLRKVSRGVDRERNGWVVGGAIAFLMSPRGKSDVASATLRVSCRVAKRPSNVVGVEGASDSSNVGGAIFLA
jgi:hypothetical protein